MTDVATVATGAVHTPPPRTDDQINTDERAAKRPCPDGSGAANGSAASLDATVSFSAVHEWWQGVRLSLHQAELDLGNRQQQMVAVEALLKERFAELQRREASVAAREASIGHREAALAILLPRLEVSNVGGAAHAPVTPQHSTQDGPKRPSPETSPLRVTVDPHTAAELAAAATRMPGNGPIAVGASSHEAEVAGVGSRSGSPMAFDQIVPALDEQPSGSNHGGITFRPIAVRKRTDGPHTPGGWRFGGGGANSAGWDGGANNTPFRPAAFAAPGTQSAIKPEPQQAAAAHSANSALGVDQGTAGGSFARAASGQLAPEPSLRGALLERSGDSNAGVNGVNGGELDSLSLLARDNHAELPLEGRDANGRKVMRRSCSRTTLTSGNCHASLTTGEAGGSEGTTAHELSEVHSGDTANHRHEVQGNWAWEQSDAVGRRHSLSLKLDLANAAAEASQQGMSADLWKGGAPNQRATNDQAVSGVKDATSSLQDLAALCANAEEVTSPGSPLAHGAGINNPAVRLSEAEMAAMDTSPDPLSVARTSLNSCGTTARGSGRRKRARAISHGPEDVTAPRSRQASPSARVAHDTISPAVSSSSGGTMALEAMGDKAAKRAEPAAPGGGGADSALSKPKQQAPVAAPQPLPTGPPVAAYSKTLDYKSCQTIMCLTKEMARHLLPSVPASVTATGASCQLPVDVVDELGRVWPMTYRCVPHRYSYEFRAGWKPFAAAWRVSAGDTVLLERHTPDRSKLHIKIMKPVRHKSASSAASAAAAAAAKARNRALLEVVQQAAVAEHLDT